MSDLSIYHGSPKELVVISVTVSGLVVATGYKVCILPTGIYPDQDTAEWQDPDSAGLDTGIFVGTETTNVFGRGDRAQPWYWLVDSPESLIERSVPTVYFN